MSANDPVEVIWPSKGGIAKLDWLRQLLDYIELIIRPHRFGNLKNSNIIDSGRNS
jgi:hypothetical protein